MGLASSTDAKKYAADFSINKACGVSNGHGTCITENIVDGSRACEKQKNFCGFNINEGEKCETAKTSDLHENIKCDEGYSPYLKQNTNSCTYECKK